MLSEISIHAPREGGDHCWAPLAEDDTAISIHAPREGGDRAAITTRIIYKISIHAPREGGDVKPDYPDAFIKISIHAPREGGDRKPQRLHLPRHPDFNPRPPRGGRPS